MIKDRKTKRTATEKKKEEEEADVTSDGLE